MCIQRMKVYLFIVSIVTNSFFERPNLLEGEKFPLFLVASTLRGERHYEFLERYFGC